MSSQDWHPGTGTDHPSRANTTGGKSQRGHKGRPYFVYRSIACGCSVRVSPNGVLVIWSPRGCHYAGTMLA